MKKIERIKWIDVARFIGIYLIFLGHFNGAPTKLLSFVYIFHVPLFFFLSGCVQNYNQEKSIVKNIIEDIKSLLIPAFIFAFLTIFITSIGNFDMNTIFHQCVNILKGCVRNTQGIYGIWFLTCLFVIRIIFQLIKKFNKISLIGIALLTYIVADFIISPSPYLSPRIYYNLDSALYYLNYFLVGYLVYPHINKLLELNNLKKKIIFVIIFMITLLYINLIIFNLNLSSFFEIHSLFKVIDSYILIMFVICVAYAFRNIKLFSNIGMNTLYLCGSERIIKTIILDVGSLLKLDITIYSPFVLIIYTFILLIIGYYLLVPMLRPIVLFIKNIKIKDEYYSS